LAETAQGLAEENPEGHSEYWRLRLSLRNSLEKLPGCKPKVCTAKFQSSVFETLSLFKEKLQNIELQQHQDTELQSYRVTQLHTYIVSDVQSYKATELKTYAVA
jgi:hypothetical protein